jgi:hypothetical protein
VHRVYMLFPSLPPFTWPLFLSNSHNKHTPLPALRSGVPAGQHRLFVRRALKPMVFRVVLFTHTTTKLALLTTDMKSNTMHKTQ